MTHTCRSYAKKTEAKAKPVHKIPKPTTVPLTSNVGAAFIDFTASPLVKKKRKSGDVPNVEQENLSKSIDSDLNGLHQHSAEEGEFCFDEFKSLEINGQFHNSKQMLNRKY